MKTTMAALFHEEAIPFPVKQRTVVVRLMREMAPEIFHYYLGAVLKRIGNFAERFDSDADPKVLARAVEIDFVRDTAEQEYFVLIAVRRGEVVGHLLAHLVDYYGNLLTYVHQLELDGLHARVSLAEKLQALEMVKRWGRERGSKKLKATALSARHTDRLEQEYGMEVKFTMLGKDI